MCINWTSEWKTEVKANQWFGVSSITSLVGENTGVWSDDHDHGITVNFSQLHNATVKNTLSHAIKVTTPNCNEKWENFNRLYISGKQACKSALNSNCELCCI